MSERSREERIADLKFNLGLYFVVGALTLGGLTRIGVNGCRAYVCWSAMQDSRVERIAPEELPSYRTNQNLNESRDERDYSP